MVAGARSGKLTTGISYSLLNGMFHGTIVCLDQKSELAAISRLQTIFRKHCRYFNPLGLAGLPSDKINPVSYIKKGSPTLVSDASVFCENMITASGGGNSRYFEDRGREFLLGIILTLVEIDGVLTLPRLYDIINLIPTGNDAWYDFAFEMSEAGHAVSARVEEEIAASRNKSSGGGTDGILGEIFAAFTCLADPVLREALSPPFDFDLSDLCGSQPTHLYLQVPSEFVHTWRAILKAFFVGANIYKARAPFAPQQTWILDECAALGSFPLAVKMFTYGAGIGIRPVAIYQSIDQMRRTGSGAETEIPASAAVQIYFGIREERSAAALSHRAGQQTLEYDDSLAQHAAQQAKKEAIRSVLLNGADPFEASIGLNHQRFAASHRSSQSRSLMMPDEIMNMPSDRQLMFMDGVDYPIFAERKPYYLDRTMAGKFHPNPYHPPHDKLQLPSFWGNRWHSVITDSVDPRFADLPQYRDGLWSYIEGYRP